VSDITLQTLPLPLQSILEWVAFTIFLCCTLGYERYHMRRTRRDPASTHHGRLLARQVGWITAMVTRDQPILFIQTFRNLGRQTVFFGSLTLLALGGAFGLLLSGERLRTLCQITYLFGHPSPVLAQLKLLFLVAVLATAFLQFVWAARAIIAAHIFTDSDLAECELRIAGLVRYLGDFQLDFRRGLRTAYYAVCLLIWPFSVEAFIVATVVLTVMVARYDLQTEG